MSGASESPIEVAPCDCEESLQLRHKNKSLEKRLDYLTVMMDEDENELISFVEENEALRRKNYHLEANNKKLRQDVELLEESHQHQADIMNTTFIYSPKPFEKDEPTEKKEISVAEVQTEDPENLKDGCTVCTTVTLEVIEGFYQQLKNDQAAMKEELKLATQKIAMLTERLEKEKEAKQALQAEYDCIKADQQKEISEVQTEDFGRHEEVFSGNRATSKKSKNLRIFIGKLLKACGY